MDLGALFQPRQIALVEDAATIPWSRVVLTNLETSGYKGKIFVVNPEQDTAQGRRCFARVNDIPGPLDLVLSVGTEQGRAEALLQDCIDKGVRSACFFLESAGLDRSAPSSANERLARTARAAGLLLAGPGSLGLLQLPRGILAWGKPIPSQLKQGPIGLVFQSNTLLDAALGSLARCGVGLHAAVATGEEEGLTAPDYLDYLLDQDEVTVVGTLLGWIADPKRFVAVADHAIRVGKPLVVLTSEQEIHPAGALSGDASVSSALFRQKGVVEVQTLDELLQTCCYLGHHPAPLGPRVFALTPSRAACRVLASVGRACGLEYPPPGRAVRAALAKVHPGIDASENPVCFPQQGNVPAELFQSGLTALSTEGYDALLFAFAGMPSDPALRAIEHQLRQLQEQTRLTGKPAIGLQMLAVNGGPPSAATSALAQHALLHGTNLGLGVLSRAARWGAFLRAYLDFDESSEPHVVFPFDARRRGLDLLEDLPDGPLDEAVSRELLAMYGVPLVPAVAASTATEATAAASELGYPVAVKALASGLASKSETGAVALEIPDDTAARVAFDQVTEAARRSGAAQVSGVIVSRMVRGSVEVLCGAMRHPRWGPAVVLGAGGKAGLLLDDRIVRVCPAGRHDLREMVRETSISKMLDGLGGRPVADRGSLVDMLERLSLLMQDLHDRIEAIELNPVAVFPAGGGCVALDALVTKSAAPPP